VIVITRHIAADRELWINSAQPAVIALSQQAGCISVEVGAATDQGDLMCIVSRWKTVGDYRRALSSFDVKMNAIPFLSTAIDEPSAYEVAGSVVNGEFSIHETHRALDADTFNLGSS
jgi:hypothetical protein